jgi:hypothetical protein
MHGAKQPNNSRVTQGPSGTWPLYTMESPPVMSALSRRFAPSGLPSVVEIIWRPRRNTANVIAAFCRIVNISVKHKDVLR